MCGEDISEFYTSNGHTQLSLDLTLAPEQHLIASQLLLGHRDYLFDLDGFVDEFEVYGWGVPFSKWARTSIGVIHVFMV